MKILTLLLATLVTQAYGANVSVVIPGPDYPQTLRINGLTVGPSSSGQDSFTHCGVIIELIRPSKRPGIDDNYRYVYYNQSYCGNLPIRPWLPRPDGESTYVAALDGVQAQFEYATTILSVPESCRYNYRINAGYRVGYYLTGWKTCDYREKPPLTSCRIIQPDVIEHPVHNVGLISSTASTTLRLSCSTDTSVSLTLDSPNLPVSSDGVKLPTTLSFKENGRPTLTTTANPDANIVISNNIDSTTGHAGIYTGTAVLVATWD